MTNLLSVMAMAGGILVLVVLSVIAVHTFHETGERIGGRD